MANPYSVLGVPKTADEKAIKSAFRKLAKKYHPDQNKDDKNAQAKFAEVNQAYEILGDKDKRGQYDRGEIDEKGNPKFAGFSGAGADPFGGFHGRTGAGASANPFGNAGFGGAEDILSELFGASFGGNAQGFANRPPPGGRPGSATSLDIEMQATIGVEELMRGKASIRMPDGKQLSISIPPEATDGQVIRLKGKGKASAGRHKGDALVKLRLRDGGKFRREGADLRLDSPVSLETAVLGGNAAIETPDGKLSLKIPAGTDSGKVFRLKSKGLPKKGGGYGDLLVTVQIQLPQDRLDDLRKLFENK